MTFLVSNQLEDCPLLLPSLYFWGRGGPHFKAFFLWRCPERKPLFLVSESFFLKLTFYMSCWEILGVEKDLRLNKAGPLLSARFLQGHRAQLPTGLLFITLLSLDWSRCTVLLRAGQLSPCVCSLSSALCLLEASHPSVQFQSFLKARASEAEW